MKKRRNWQAASRSKQPGWIDVMVELERPAASELVNLTRSERYRTLRDSAHRHCHTLTCWLEEHDLCDGVMTMGEPTALHMLFLRCTPAVAAALREAPGVLDVTVTSEDAIELRGVAEVRQSIPGHSDATLDRPL